MRERGKTVKLIIGTFLLLSMGTPSYAAMMERDGQGGGFAKPAVNPNSEIKVHDVGKIWLTISNYAQFANPRDLADPRNPDAIAPSCMFPGGSNLEYLFAGFLWIGAERDTIIAGNPGIDTLVSIGGDGWLDIDSEMWPDFPPNGEIIVRSTRPPDVYPYGDTAGAISEQDFISVFTDTKTDRSYVPIDSYDGKPHRPLGIEVVQKSYAWSYEYAEDFVLFDYDITNIGDQTLQNVWLGLYIDADVWHTSENPYGAEQGAQDDICGFVDSVATSQIHVNGDTVRTGIFTAYIADNDGQVYNDAFDAYLSPRGVSGVRVVRTPIPDLQYGFNWWISNTDAALDWGPQLWENFIGAFPSGGFGTPGPDWSKYFVMSNGEFDYDQIWTNQDWTDQGWVQSPPAARAEDLANGYDTRYLFSFGPFPQISPGETLKLTTAYVCGENLHVDPANYENNLRTATADSFSVREYYNNLDFQDFATNSQWADWVYDNPGVDSEEPYADENENGEYDPGEPFRDNDGDGAWTGPDGYRGEYVLVGNIANPDTFWYKGDAVPDFRGPPPPPSPRLTAETSPGVVTLNWDGSETETAEDNFSNEIDFEGYRIYMSRTGRLGEYSLVGDFDVIDFDSTYLDTTVTPNEWVLWKEPPRRLEDFPAGFDPDTSENWVANGWNTGLGPVELGDRMYSYTISGLSESVGMYFSVTAYDFGNPVTNLSPLESSQTINVKYVYAIAKGDQAQDVAVYPNPYKITGNYVELGYEDPDKSGFVEFDRRIMFAGLPSKCTIRIFTLDGDLVRAVDHDDSTSPEGPGVNYWDLISRNTQAVVSGIYIYSIDGESGFHQLGKIAIIK